MNTQKLLEQFILLSHNEKYDKVMVVLGLVKKEIFLLQELYVNLSLLAYDTTDDDLLSIYKTLLEINSLDSFQKQEESISLYNKKIQAANLLYKKNQENSEDADSLLSRIA